MVGWPKLVNNRSQSVNVFRDTRASNTRTQCNAARRCTCTPCVPLLLWLTLACFSADGMLSSRTSPVFCQMMLKGGPSTLLHCPMAIHFSAWPCRRCSAHKAQCLCRRGVHFAYPALPDVIVWLELLAVYHPREESQSPLMLTNQFVQGSSCQAQLHLLCLCRKPCMLGEYGGLSPPTAADFGVHCR